jgi:hypothetical protein
MPARATGAAAMGSPPPAGPADLAAGASLTNESHAPHCGQRPRHWEAR